MTAKQAPGIYAPDGSQYVVLADGAGNLAAGTGGGPVTQSGTWTVQPGNTANTTAWKVDGSAVTQPVSNAGTFAAQAAQSGTWTVQPGNTANTTAWKVDGSAVTQPTKEIRSSTGTQSSVASSATDVTILASNANRLGASVFNDSTTILYLLVGAGTSSATVHTVQLAANSYYEVPSFYTGILKGLWSSANGSARVTEFS